jgi:NitT/TauT family transport system substrate-binding protein
MDCTRRELMRGLTLAGMAGLLGPAPETARAEPPPETSRIRLVRIPSICRAPQYVADDLLRGQGFTDIEYVPKVGGGASVMALAAGQADISMNYSGPVIVRISTGDPLVVLAGIHIGCFELFGTDRVRSISDLKGKTGR